MNTCYCGEDIEQHRPVGRVLLCPDNIHEFDLRFDGVVRTRCDHCGEWFGPRDERAEVVAIGQEGVPIEDHMIVHADPCYLGHIDIYTLA